ncbi:uncharacterized protein LOC123548641 [Mercenaria mercenaria]|uniref:uncharacterized protein LOC123548641 n=1 Tax=Mercenaria mercenaria TaxID=6596 RepID=UPI00234F6DDD|nr:uncharacterized protein LOC123548641 [Mercenaria mercenaria]
MAGNPNYEGQRPGFVYPPKGTYQLDCQQPQYLAGHSCQQPYTMYQQGPQSGVYRQHRLWPDMSQQQGLQEATFPQQDPQQAVYPQQGPRHATFTKQGPQQAMFTQQCHQQANFQNQRPQQATYLQQGPQQAMYAQQGPQQTMNAQQGSQQTMNAQQGPQQTMNAQQGPQQTMNAQQGPQQAMYAQQGPQQTIFPQQVLLNNVFESNSMNLQLGPQQAVNAQGFLDYHRFDGIAHAGILDFKTCPDMLLDLSLTITVEPLRTELKSLHCQALKIGNDFIGTFSHQGANVLRMKHKLAKVNCPGKVDIDNLSRSVNNFKTVMKLREAKTIGFRSVVHNLTEKCREEKLKAENKRTIASMEKSSSERQIKNAEIELKRIQREIVQIENAAVDLENRALDLKRKCNEYRQKGNLWGIFTAAAGFVLGFFTAGATVVPALVIAGIGAKVNFNSADDCELNARRLQESANDKNLEAQRQKKTRDYFMGQKNANENRLDELEREIYNLWKTGDAMYSIEQFLYHFISKIGYVTEVLQELDLKLHETHLENGTFKMLQELFFEDELTFSEIANEGLSELKARNVSSIVLISRKWLVEEFSGS